VGEIGPGLCVLLGIATSDERATAERLAAKTVRLRVFENDEGKFDRSLLDVGGEALVVSQFTLIADSKRQKGTRPDFSGAARREIAEPLYDHFCEGCHQEIADYCMRDVELVRKIYYRMCFTGEGNFTGE
jgi:D-tyrosyl-tRNA(Tyr) deacylase